MPAGHHTRGEVRCRPGTSAGEKVTVFVSWAASGTLRVKCVPPTLPEISAVTGAPESLRAWVFTVRSAVASEGTARSVTTCASRSATGPPLRTRTSRTSPMFRSGGGWSQSSQPIVRSWSGSLGRTRRATVLVPDLTSEVMSSSWWV